jgi:hypothetical protein
MSSSWRKAQAPDFSSFSEEQRSQLMAAFGQDVVLTNPFTAHYAVLRVNRSGDVEILTTTGNRKLQVAATLTNTAGALSTAGASGGGAGFNDPGR